MFDQIRLPLLLVIVCLASCGQTSQETSPLHSGWAKSIRFIDEVSGKEYEVDTVALLRDSEGNNVAVDLQLYIKVYATKVDIYLGSSGRTSVPQLSKSLKREFVKSISWRDGYTNLPEN